jgi:N-acetylglucosamine-6-phosphate deacetylase
MTPNPILGRHYRTGQPVALWHHQGHIERCEPLPANTPHLPWLAPSLIDLQVNGFAGVDFQQDTLAPSQLEQAIAGLQSAACSRFLLTLITDRWPRLLHRLDHLRQCREASPHLRHAIAGWHIEGPFLSEEPGFHGAHDPAHLLDPTPQHIATLHEIVHGDPMLITLAPERPGAIPTIHAAVKAGFRVFLGHTNAPTPILEQAFEAGATGFTHLGNACPQLLDRHDNILWRVLDLLRRPKHAARPWTATLIPDGIHISPALFRLFHAALAPRQPIYVSDAMAAAATPPGLYPLGRLTLQVGPDGVARQPGGTNFAGSTLRPLDGVFRAASILGQPWADCWDRFSLLPAQWLGLEHGLDPGCPLDLVLLDKPDPSSAVRLLG